MPIPWAKLLAETWPAPRRPITICPSSGGYIAHEHIIGISKLTRLVRVFDQRFAVQECIGQQIADSLEAMLEPHGVAVYLEAHHLCMQMRGVREVSPLTRTTFWRGEFLAICGVSR
jgi:GTP cyclohydrolase I